MFTWCMWSLSQQHLRGLESPCAACQHSITSSDKTYRIQPTARLVRINIQYSLLLYYVSELLSFIWQYSQWLKHNMAFFIYWFCVDLLFAFVLLRVFVLTTKWIISTDFLISLVWSHADQSHKISAAYFCTDAVMVLFLTMRRFMHKKYCL